MPLPESYQRWNRVLVQHCLLESTETSGPAHLTVTPSIVSAALETVDGEVLTPEDAEAALLEAVRRAYRTAILESSRSLSVLSGSGMDGLPQSVAFLAVSVLAAYQMRTDEDVNARGYYLRLSQELGCSMAGQYPQGFDADAFDGLWDSLSEWLQARTGSALSVPPVGVYQRHIAYPLTHVLLRRVDAEKLPELFESLGLDPGSRVELPALGRALEGWSLLSRAGRQALMSDRREAVEEQVAAELEAWDGSVNDRSGGRTAVVQIFLQFARSRPILQFLARRTSSFPATFDDGEHVFETADDRCYEPVRLRPEDGSRLVSGFRWTSGPLSLSRPPSKVIPLRPASEMSGLISKRGLPLGDKSAVLCIDAFEPQVRQYLNAITGGDVCSPIEHADIPIGWKLFRDVVASSVIGPSSGLEALAVDTSVTVKFQGGLRLGQRAVWLRGAPPAILVSGPREIEASVDGRVLTVTGGVLESSALSAVGVHTIKIGRVVRGVEVAEAEYTPGAGRELVPKDRRLACQPIALPPGRWTLIGPTPEDIYGTGRIQTGALARAPFPPEWAIDVGESRRTTVALCVTSRPSRPFITGATRVTRTGAAWAELIRSAHVRHARLGFLTVPDSQVDLSAVWSAYWDAARALRRRWKRHR